MLRLPGSVQTGFSETWDLCASKALVTLLRPPGEGRRNNTYNRSAVVGERSGVKREGKGRGGDACSEDNRTKEEGTLSRKEGARTHAAHLSQLHERVDVV